MTVVSNALIGEIRDVVRSNAIESFAFFANAVCGHALSEELCERVQDAVDQELDGIILSSRPHALALSMTAWLSSRGVRVVTNASSHDGEVLRWLELEPRETDNAIVLLGLRDAGVVLVWS